MCYSPEVSLGTFLFAVSVTSLAVYVEFVSVPWAVFLMSFASMQLVEFFLWINLKNPSVNALLSLAGLALILLQPVAAGLLVPDARERAAYWAAYALFCALFLYSQWPIQLRTGVAENMHLSWHWLTGDWMIFLAWIGFICYAVWRSSDTDIRMRALVVAFVLGTAAFSWSQNHKYQGAWGSHWCWISNAAFVFLLLRMAAAWRVR